MSALTSRFVRATTSIRTAAFRLTTFTNHHTGGLRTLSSQNNIPKSFSADKNNPEASTSTTTPTSSVVDFERKTIAPNISPFDNANDNRYKFAIAAGLSLTAGFAFKTLYELQNQRDSLATKPLIPVPSGDADQYTKTVNVTGLADALINPNRHEFPPGTKVVDLGCGEGFATQKLLKACPGIEVTAVDYSNKMVSSIKAKNIPGIIDVIQADAGNLPIGENQPLKPGYFDRVFSLSALHWVPNFKGLVSGMASLLKPGGKIIAEFAHESPPELREAIDKVVTEMYGAEVAQDVAKSDPWQKTTPTQWAEELKKNGFDKDKIKIKPVERIQPLSGEEGMKNWLKMFAIPFFTPILEPLKETAQANIIEEKLVSAVAVELKEKKHGLYNPLLANGTENPNPWQMRYRRGIVDSTKQL